MLYVEAFFPACIIYNILYLYSICLYIHLRASDKRPPRGCIVLELLNFYADFAHADVNLPCGTIVVVLFIFNKTLL